jgi:hypothetical protein
MVIPHSTPMVLAALRLLPAGRCLAAWVGCYRSGGRLCGARMHVGEWCWGATHRRTSHGYLPSTCLSALLACWHPSGSLPCTSALMPSTPITHPPWCAGQHVTFHDCLAQRQVNSLPLTSRKHITPYCDNSASHLTSTRCTACGVGSAGWQASAAHTNRVGLDSSLCAD